MRSPRGTDTQAGRAYLAVAILFYILAVAAVGLRVLAKHKKGKRGFESHDWLIFVALFFGTANLVDDIAIIVDGPTGLHIEDVDPTDIPNTLKGWFTAQFIWICATAAVKLSIVCLLQSIFRTPWLVKATKVVGLVTILFWIAVVIASFVTCLPVAYFWDKTIPGGRCGNETALEISEAAINMALDLALVLLPAPVTWQLSLSMRKKVYITGVFSLGVIITIVNATRLGLEWSFRNSEDVTYTAVYIGVFTVLDIYLSIIVACVPCFGPLLFSNTGLPGSSTPAGPTSSKNVFLWPRGFTRRYRRDPTDTTFDDTFDTSRNDVNRSRSASTLNVKQNRSNSENWIEISSLPPKSANTVVDERDGGNIKVNKEVRVDSEEI